MKNKRMKEALVVPRAMRPLANGEAAVCGEALAAQNVREQEQALQVTGTPAVAGAIAVGDRLLLVSDGHRVTCRDGRVKIDNAVVATVDSAIVGAHALGGLIVVVAEGGLTYLGRTAGTWQVMDPADAVPRLTFGERQATMGTAIDAYTFETPYGQWQAPLAAADCAALAAKLRQAWSALTADIAAEGRHAAPMLVRWGVRLHDDSYLWMSEPVRVGDNTLANADRITALVTTGSGGFTGTEATTLALRHYALDISVTQNIGAAWLPLVKSIDVLVTDEARLLTASRQLDYRCLTRTTGGREQVLEMGLSRRSADAVTAQLAASPWHLALTAPAAASLTGSDFVAPLSPLTLTNADCAAIGRLPVLDDVVASTAAAGRLYCCTARGDVIVSAPGNPLAEAHRRAVLGAVPLALAVVTRPLYSGGFGRYPVYVFSDDGIFAIPQSATGTLGEARLVDRTVIAAAVPPVEGDGDVWFMSRHGHLCRLSGARVEVVLREVDCTALAWCNAYRELWLLPSSGYPMVLMASRRLSVRTVPAAQLYSDPRHALAVSDDGSLLDLEQEKPAAMPVVWRSHPVPIDVLMGERLHRVVWHLSSQAAELTLRVTGQRGIMAGDADVSVITVDGAIVQPLAAPVLPLPSRMVRLSVEGTAATGTLILPTHLAQL